VVALHEIKYHIDCLCRLTGCMCIEVFTIVFNSFIPLIETVATGYSFRFYTHP